MVSHRTFSSFLFSPRRANKQTNKQNNKTTTHRRDTPGGIVGAFREAPGRAKDPVDAQQVDRLFVGSETGGSIVVQGVGGCCCPEETPDDITPRTGEEKNR